MLMGGLLTSDPIAAAPSNIQAGERHEGRAKSA